MAVKADNNEFLFLHDFDQYDFDRYKNRLERVFEIVNFAEEVEYDKLGKEGVYRLRINDTIDMESLDRTENFHEVRVSILEMEGAISPVIKMSVFHTDFHSDFDIHECLPVGANLPSVDNVDDVLDLIERWQNLCDSPFTAGGEIGSGKLQRVHSDLKRASELLNAVVHAYMEFSEDEKFVVKIVPCRPYMQTAFHQIIDGNAYNFLSTETKAAIDQRMPNVVQLHYSAEASLTKYWLGPLVEQHLEISAATLPSQDELISILQPLIKAPVPHLLEKVQPV